MTPFRYAIFIAVVVALSGSALAQTRGTGRIFGTVKDAKGQPVIDARIEAVKVGDDRPLTARTNTKGDRAIAGIAPGRWHVDTVEDGDETRSISIDVPELERLPSIDIRLEQLK